MSESVTVHLRGPFTLDELCRCVELTIGHPLAKDSNVEWNLLRTACLGLELSVYENRDFEDDSGIEFTAFSFVVSVDALPDSIEHEHSAKYQEMVGRVLALSCCRELKSDCIVVRNLQHLVGSYGDAKCS